MILGFSRSAECYLHWRISLLIKPVCLVQKSKLRSRMLSSKKWKFLLACCCVSYAVFFQMSWTRLALESQEVQGEKTLEVLLLQHLFRYFSFTSYFLYMLSWTVLWLERRSKREVKVEAEGKQRFLWFPKNQKKRKTFLAGARHCHCILFILLTKM